MTHVVPVRKLPLMRQVPKPQCAYRPQTPMQTQTQDSDSEHNLSKPAATDVHLRQQLTDEYKWLKKHLTSLAKQSQLSSQRSTHS